MKSTSINSDESAGVLDRPEMEKYRSLAPDGSLQSPYASLPKLILPDGTVVDAVREGTGAMRAYEEMLFGVHTRGTRSIGPRCGISCCSTASLMRKRW